MNGKLRCKECDNVILEKRRVAYCSYACEEMQARRAKSEREKAKIRNSLAPRCNPKDGTRRYCLLKAGHEGPHQLVKFRPAGWYVG